MEHVASYLKQCAEIAEKLDAEAVTKIVEELTRLRERNGRLFFLGVGGSAANASHAVNDFRKLAGIETYFPGDNVSELTARTNDEGWESVFKAWLATSRINENDAVFVLSVGGGSRERNVSVNLVEAIDFARSCGAKVFGVVGRDGGHTAKTGDVVVRIPTVDDALVTPHTESYQSVVLHCITSHPKLLKNAFKWESLGGQ